MCKMVPVMVISGIVAWSYYAYVIHLCILTVKSDIEKILLLIGYHITITLFLLCYWRTIWTRPGDIPKKFQLTAAELDIVEGCNNFDTQKRLLDQIVIDRDLPVAMRTYQGAVRFCEKCAHIKPDRAHHCSMCGRCILKMDHHCPWVNNCVSFHNYKFFVLFLFYGFLYCIFVCLSSLKYFIQFWTKSGDGNVIFGTPDDGYGKFHILFLFFVSTMFGISLCSLLGYHIHLVLNNRSTLEAFRGPVFRDGPSKEGFSLGKSGNICEVFGEPSLLMLLPVFTSLGDGLTFPIIFPEDAELGQGQGVRFNHESIGWDEGKDESVPMLAAEVTDSVIDSESAPSGGDDDYVAVNMKGSEYA